MENRTLHTPEMNILPVPKEIAGTSEKQNVSATLYFDAGLEAQAEYFLEYLGKLGVTGISLTHEASAAGIKVMKNAALSSDEYCIDIADQEVRVSCGMGDGVRYALATLLMLIASAEKKEDGTLLLPVCSLRDKPDMEYRALMVDLARQWHPFETLLKYVDICFFYKMKYLHLHFMDAQSYTLPTRAFPMANMPDRHYTEEQIAYLNRYAYVRGVELIPEIEIPGHCTAIANIYRSTFLCDRFDKSVYNGLMCAGKETIMDTIATLVSEAIELFPHSRYLHIGGDEADISQWNHCKDCTKYMEEHGIADVKALYTHFIKRVTDMVLSMGRTPIVWEGFPKEGAEQLSREILVQPWESYYHLASELAEEGFSIVNCAWKPLYIVPPKNYSFEGGRWSPDEIFDWDVYTWRNWNEKSPAYHTPDVVKEKDRSMVRGASLCAWENNYDDEMPKIIQNLGAVSERTWNLQRRISKEAFLTSLQRYEQAAKKLLDLTE